MAKQVGNGHYKNMLQNAPNKLESVSNEHRALALLRLLFRAPAYRSNELLLYDWLSEIGLACTSSQLRRQVRELEETELLEISDVKGNVVVELSSRGAEVAEGRLIIEGVLRPAPECTY